MPRFTKIRRTGAGESGNGYENLYQQLLQLYRQKNLSRLISGVQQLERIPSTPPQTLGRAYLLVCALGSERGNYVAVVEHALKVSQGNFEAQLRIGAAGFVGQAVQEIRKADQPSQDRVRSLFCGFAGNHLRVADLEPMVPEEKAMWLSTFHTLMPNRYLREQLYLAEEVFGKHTDEGYRADAAQIYLLIARWLKRQQDATFDPAKLRAMAEFSVDKRSAIMKTWDQESLHSTMVDLGCFELWDLQERILAACEPPADDPIWLYQRLTQKIREGTDPAHQELQAVLPLIPKHTNPTITAELRILQICIQREYLELHQKSVAEPAVLPTAASRFERVLLQPSRDWEAIQKALQSLRAEAFRQLKPAITRGDYGLWIASSFPLAGFPSREAFLVFAPYARAVEVYLADQDRRYMKMAYPLMRNHSGNPFSASTSTVFPGVEAGRRAAVPLLWEYLSLGVVLATAGAERAAKILETFNTEIKKAAFAMFLTENREVFSRLQETFGKTPDYQTLLIDLENRQKVCRRIFERFAPAVESRSYALDPLDILYSLIEEIRILPKEELRETLRESLYADPFQLAPSSARTAAVFPFGVIAKTRSGEELWCVIRDFEEVDILGVKSREGDLLPQFLAGAALEAAIKIHATYVEKRKGKEPRSGYVLDPEGKLDAPSGTSAAALDVLTKIYQTEFYKQLREVGLLAVPWFIYKPVNEKEGLYHPLEDQSPGAKRKALAEIGAHRIFIQVEPNGYATRLPVRLKKVDGKLVPAPWERNPLREQQQELLGDTQPLPNYYGLYVITSFSDGTYHIYLYELRKTQEAILSDELLNRVEQEVRQGNFRDPKKLLRTTAKSKREELARKLERGKITIAEQTAEIFALQTTFRRPHLTTVSALLEQEVPLEAKPKQT